MPHELMNLEQIEAHIQKANLSQYTRIAVPAGPDAAALKKRLETICELFDAVEPILDQVRNFPLLPATIKSAVNTYINAMNTMCG